MSDQGENGQAERRQLVAAEVEKLTKHLESVGLDQAKASVGEVLEAMLVVARTLLMRVCGPSTGLRCLACGPR